MPGILYPAYQKLYSALSCLKRFNIEASFIDNIANLDTFFSEFRNITFVIQKSIRDKKVYEKNRDLYLAELKWFVDKRNETIKEKPFQLIKEILITVYNRGENSEITRKSFTLEDDIPILDFLKTLKKELSNFNNHEVFFSAEFFFHENGSDIDLIEKLFEGISSMFVFLEAIENELQDDCKYCQQLKDKIRRFELLMTPKKSYKNIDYVYYPSKDIFEKAKVSHANLSFNGFIPLKRIPSETITKFDLFNFDGTFFGNLSYMQAVIQSDQNNDIMPVLGLVYNDETCLLDIFNSTIKTTLFRKINEIAQLIKNGDIIEVCFIGNVSVLECSTNDIKFMPKISKERIALSTTELLVCAKLDDNLNGMEYVFNKKFLRTPGYIKCVMKNWYFDRLYNCKSLFKPIQEAFELLNNK